MILKNHSSGIVEFDGPIIKFAGIEVYQQANPTAVFSVELSESESLEQFRSEIQCKAGDYEQILGAVADASQILMMAVGRLLKGLQNGNTINDIIASDPALSMCLSFVDAHDNGTMSLPYEQKTDNQAIDDIIGKTNSVAMAYKEKA